MTRQSNGRLTLAHCSLARLRLLSTVPALDFCGKVDVRADPTWMVRCRFVSNNILQNATC